jgi:succinate dehydrogenase hydrophobic anchor subunit
VRESTLRFWVHATGLLAFALLVVHLVRVFWGPGDFTYRISYPYVATVLEDQVYVISLGLLLGVSLLHAFLGVRRTLLDTNARAGWLYLLGATAVVSSGALIYLFVSTPW